MFSINIVCYNIVTVIINTLLSFALFGQLSLMGDKAALYTLVTQIVINYLKRNFLFINYK